MNKLTRNIDRQTFVDGIARTANSTFASVFLKKKTVRQAAKRYETLLNLLNDKSNKTIK
jgi:hypothetical protein